MLLDFWLSKVWQNKGILPFLHGHPKKQTKKKTISEVSLCSFNSSKYEIIRLREQRAPIAMRQHCDEGETAPHDRSLYSLDFLSVTQGINMQKHDSCCILASGRWGGWIQTRQETFEMPQKKPDSEIWHHTQQEVRRFMPFITSGYLVTLIISWEASWKTATACTLLASLENWYICEQLLCDKLWMCTLISLWSCCVRTEMLQLFFSSAFGLYRLPGGIFFLFLAAK